MRIWEIVAVVVGVFLFAILVWWLLFDEVVLMMALPYLLGVLTWWLLSRDST